MSRFCRWVAALALLGPSVAAAQSGTDSLNALAAVQRFHGALERGDSLTALDLLAEDAVVLESGSRESKAEYRGHHLPGDIAFARELPGRSGARSVTVDGNVAWVTSTSSTTGEFRGRKIDAQGAELIVLTRGPQGWRIRAIHWSSRPRATK
jgi:ketosteroid isomerase-like protein